MSSYLLRRLLLIIPTLFGIMLINFAVVQIVPGGPVEQMIAQMTGTAIESTARFSGNAEGESLENFNIEDLSKSESKYRGSQGLDPDIIKEIEIMYGMDKPAHQRFFNMIKDYIVFAPYEKFVDICIDYLEKSQEERDLIAERAYEHFKTKYHINNFIKI